MLNVAPLLERGFGAAEDVEAHAPAAQIRSARAFLEEFRNVRKT
jgi:hypothetical protein